MKRIKETDTVTYISSEVGTDREVEYIKVLSGKVIERKPSFAIRDEISEILKEHD